MKGESALARGEHCLNSQGLRFFCPFHSPTKTAHTVKFCVDSLTLWRYSQFISGWLSCFGTSILKMKMGVKCRTSHLPRPLNSLPVTKSFTIRAHFAAYSGNLKVSWNMVTPGCFNFNKHLTCDIIAKKASARSGQVLQEVPRKYVALPPMRMWILCDVINLAKCLPGMLITMVPQTGLGALKLPIIAWGGVQKYNMFSEYAVSKTELWEYRYQWPSMRIYLLLSLRTDNHFLNGVVWNGRGKSVLYQ